MATIHQDFLTGSSRISGPRLAVGDGQLQVSTYSFVWEIAHAR